MKFEVKNIGPIKDASVEIGDLTIICGKSNVGKTYYTYILNSFLDTINHNLSLPLPSKEMNKLLQTGTLTVDMEKYIDKYRKVIQNTLPNFTNTLPRFMAASPARFTKTSTHVELTYKEIHDELNEKDSKGQIEFNIKITTTCILKVVRQYNTSQVTFLLFNKGEQLPDLNIIKEAAASAFARMFATSPTKPIFPPPFIITCERTGVALFRNKWTLADMIVARSEESEEKKKDIRDVLTHRGIQRPVSKDLEFVFDFPNIIKEESYIPKEHPEIITFFQEIAGGTYIFDKDTNQVVFQPKRTKKRLDMAESSSTVRTLMELNFYLKHKAKRRQLLMLDEPEMNLQPENQCKLTRLLVMLVNAGIRVFITTHSDYFVREINTMVMLGACSSKQRSRIAKKYKYHKDHVLSSAQIRAYELQQNGTISAADIDDEVGITIESMDSTLTAISRIQRAILRGE